MNKSKLHTLRKITNYRIPLRTTLLVMLFPYMIIAVIISMPAFTGIAITVGEMDPFVIEEPERTEISELFLILFPLFSWYSLIYLMMFTVWIFLSVGSSTLDEEKTKLEGAN